MCVSAGADYQCGRSVEYSVPYTPLCLHHNITVPTPVRAILGRVCNFNLQSGGGVNECRMSTLAGVNQAPAGPWAASGAASFHQRQHTLSEIPQDCLLHVVQTKMSSCRGAGGREGNQKCIHNG